MQSTPIRIRNNGLFFSFYDVPLNHKVPSRSPPSCMVPSLSKKNLKGHMTKMASEGHILGFLLQKQCSRCRRHGGCLESSFSSRHSSICWVILHHLQFSRGNLWMKSKANHLPRSTSPLDIILPPSDSPCKFYPATGQYGSEQSRPAVSPSSPTQSHPSIPKTKPHKRKPSCSLFTTVRKVETI